MPLRMLIFILSIIVLVTFIGLNLDNTATVKLWFNDTLTFENVSVVLSFLIVYVAGLLSSIPFWIKRENQLKNKIEKKNIINPKSGKKGKKSETVNSESNNESSKNTDTDS